MSETLTGKTLLQILFQTPTVSVIRGGRADHPGWRARLAAAGLPAELAEVISRVVVGTRL